MTRIGKKKSSFCRSLTPVFFILLVGTASGCTSGEVVYDSLRESMVREQIIERGVTDEAVISAMKNVPRHLFVPEEYKSMAYIDSPLPIGRRQTISQPYVVALMTAFLRPDSTDRILEVGTGSGYQAAVLAMIVDSVYTIEILPELASRSSALLDSLGYGNVEAMTGDGYNGWPQKAPFDGVIVTAAAPRVPELLIEQLKMGGMLVIPEGSFPQRLNVYEKTPEGLKLHSSVPVQFVPMTGRIRERNEKTR